MLRQRRLRVFISYRREDTSGYAGRLHDRLSQRFGSKQIFMDIDTIQPGVDFAKVIKDSVSACDALVALIGKEWLTITDESGKRRLENAADLVRTEIATALERNILVIPTLIRGATTPRREDLPADLAELVDRNAVELSDRRWDYDVDEVIKALEALTSKAMPLRKYLAMSLTALAVAALLASWLWYRRVKKETPPAVISTEAFNPPCPNPSYPQPPPQNKLRIDVLCGTEGYEDRAENVVKNNFCASGVPQEITFADLKNLQLSAQQDPQITFGQTPMSDRTHLRQLGEGKLVSLRGYVLFARPEGPENVNCSSSVPDSLLVRDIHIGLVDSPDATDECSSVTVEMSPHHRPDDWTAQRVNKVGRDKAFQKVLVRVTGQLMFDSAHSPCVGGQPTGSNPKRVSLWEIHPIYKFEVCTANCEGSGKWFPLTEWVKE